MSEVAVSPNQHSSDSKSRSVGDAFFAGVMVMLCVNLAQRIVGLVRSFGFCRLLSEQDLGNWALANSFLSLIIPIATLGLTGGFARFVEHYRRRNQLANYLRPVFLSVGFGTLGIVSWIGLWRGSFGWVVFGHQISTLHVLGCIAAFSALMMYTVVYELIAALREVRVMSLMQFCQSGLFAVMGLTSVYLYESWLWLLPSFAVANLIACGLGGWVLATRYREELTCSGDTTSRSVWGRILPFAVSLWILNLLGNLMEVGDRYMLLHLSESVELGHAAVGEYHCAMVIPNLMMSVAMMLGGVVLPFLARDYESGNFSQVNDRLRQVLCSLSLGFIGLGIAAQIAAPTMFSIVFEGRYTDALGVIPIALALTVWLSLFFVLESYFLCIERTWPLIWVNLIGVVLNLGLNWILISYMGLTGAVIATATAILCTLLGTLIALSAVGCRLGRAPIALCLVPICLAFGPLCASLAMVALVLIAGRTDWLLNGNDRNDIDAMILPKVHKLGLRISTLWP